MSSRNRTTPDCTHETSMQDLNLPCQACLLAERNRLRLDVFNAVRAGSELRSMLRVAAGDVQRIDALLSPGMRAGTAEAKEKLKHLLTNIREALDAEQ